MLRKLAAGLTIFGAYTGVVIFDRTAKMGHRRTDRFSSDRVGMEMP